MSCGITRSGMITDNCTTGIRTQRAAADRAPWNWRMLLNGHLDELLYERGLITTNLAFAELKQHCHINARAKTADNAEDFSQQIRNGVPGCGEEPQAPGTKWEEKDPSN